MSQNLKNLQKKFNGSWHSRRSEVQCGRGCSGGGYAVCFSEAIFTVRTRCSYLIIPYSSPLTNSNGVPEIYSIRGVHGPTGSEGNLPTEDNALLFFNKCQGIFYTCPVDTVDTPKAYQRT